MRKCHRKITDHVQPSLPILGVPQYHTPVLIDADGRLGQQKPQFEGRRGGAPWPRCTTTRRKLRLQARMRGSTLPTLPCRASPVKRNAQREACPQVSNMTCRLVFTDRLPLPLFTAGNARGPTRQEDRHGNPWERVLHIATPCFLGQLRELICGRGFGVALSGKIVHLDGPDARRDINMYPHLFLPKAKTSSRPMLKRCEMYSVPRALREPNLQQSRPWWRLQLQSLHCPLRSQRCWLRDASESSPWPWRLHES